MPDKKRVIRLLSHEDVLKCGAADMDFSESVVKKSFMLVGKQQVILPKKTTLKPSSSSKGHINIMPSIVHMEQYSLFGVKHIGSSSSNLSQGLPRASGVVILFEEETKSPLCIMDVEAISTFRTAAVTRLAGRYIFSVPIKIGLFIGAGIHAKAQLLALSPYINEHTKIYVYSRGASKHEFVESMKSRIRCELKSIEKVDELAQRADAIVGCIPNLGDPILKDIQFKEGVNFLNIGLIDCAPELIPTFDRIIVDDWASSKSRGDAPHIFAYQKGLINDEVVESIISIIMGEQEGRRNLLEKIFFSPVGLGSHDVIFAHEIYQKALQKGVGTSFVLSEFTPYI